MFEHKFSLNLPRVNGNIDITKTKTQLSITYNILNYVFMGFSIAWGGGGLPCELVSVCYSTRGLKALAKQT